MSESEEAKQTEPMSVKDKIKAFENKNKVTVMESHPKVSSPTSHSTPSELTSCLSSPSSVQVVFSLYKLSACL